MTARAESPAAVFRLPRSAYVAVMFFGLGITVFVRHPVLLLLYLLPLLAAAFVARRGTAVARETITVRAIFGRTTVPWTDVNGLLVDARSGVSVALSDGSALRLPYVRARHLPVLTQITGGTVPAIPTSPSTDQEPAGTEAP